MVDILNSEQICKHIRWLNEENGTGGEISCAGYYTNMPHHSQKRTGIDEWVIIYCVGGKGYVACNGAEAERNAQEGDIFCLPPNTPHEYKSSEAEPWSIYWMHCKALLGSSIMECLPFASRAGQPHALQAAMKELLAEMEKPPSEIAAAKCRALAQLFLLKCADTKPENNQMQNAKQWIDEHFSEDVSVSQIAGHFMLSEFHFIRKFSEYTGLSPHKYQITARIRHACALLENGGMSIAEISEHTGYSSPFYFSRQFKQTTGYSPSAYVKKVKSI